MAFKMKGPSLHKGTAGHKKANDDYSQMRINRTMDKTSLADGKAGSSPFQAKNMGSFIDGERATYADAEAAAAKGGNVTHTNAQAQRKADSQGTESGDQLRNAAYKGPGGKEQKAWEKAKADDTRAQNSMETRSGNKKKDEGRKSRGNPTLADKDGYKGTAVYRASNKAFDEKNSKIKTEKGKKPLTGDNYQSVKGASKTISTRGAQKSGDTNSGDYKTFGGAKNVKDYAREKKQAKRKALKDKTNK